MKTIKFIFLLLLLICTNIDILALPNRVADEKTVAHLKKFRSDYIKSVRDKKPELIQGYFEENIRLMPEFQKTIIGKNNAITYHQAFSARFDIQEYSREEIEILDLGSQVVELGSLSMKMVLKSTGEEHELKGKYQNFWKKLDNGGLLLITEAWNYNHHTELAEQLRFAEVPAIHMALQPHLPINSNVSFELAALNKLSEEVVTQHDWKTWSRFYVDDGMIIYSYNPIYKGREALDEFFEKHASEMPVFEKLDIRNDRIDDLGDYVIEYATHVANWRHGEYSGVGTGKNIGIWRRESDGSLKLFRKMAMYD